MKQTHDCNKECDHNSFWYDGGQFIVGVLIGVLLVFGSHYISYGSLNTTYELGNAICEKEYNMSYSNYAYKILYCKEGKQLLEYKQINVIKADN